MNEDPGAAPGGRTISWTVEGTQALEAAYQAAVAAGEDNFTYDGNQYLVSYAKYLIEYLAGEFQRRGLWPTA